MKSTISLLQLLKTVPDANIAFQDSNKGITRLKFSNQLHPVDVAKIKRKFGSHKDFISIDNAWEWKSSRYSDVIWVVCVIKIKGAPSKMLN